VVDKRVISPEKEYCGSMYDMADWISDIGTSHAAINSHSLASAGEFFSKLFTTRGAA